MTGLSCSAATTSGQPGQLRLPRTRAGHVSLCIVRYVACFSRKELAVQVKPAKMLHLLGILRSLQHTFSRKKHTTRQASQFCMKLITLCRVCMGGGCTQQFGHMPAIRRESRLLSRSHSRVSPLMLDAQNLSLPSWGCVACSVAACSSCQQGGIMLARAIRPSIEDFRCS